MVCIPGCWESHSEVILDFFKENLKASGQLIPEDKGKVVAVDTILIFKKEKNKKSRKWYQFVGESLDHYVGKHLGKNTTIIRLSRIKLILINQEIAMDAVHFVLSKVFDNVSLCYILLDRIV